MGIDSIKSIWIWNYRKRFLSCVRKILSPFWRQKTMVCGHPSFRIGFKHNLDLTMWKIVICMDFLYFYKKLLYVCIWQCIVMSLWLLVIVHRIRVEWCGWLSANPRSTRRVQEGAYNWHYTSVFPLAKVISSQTFIMEFVIINARTTFSLKNRGNIWWFFFIFSIAMKFRRGMWLDLILNWIKYQRKNRLFNRCSKSISL